MVAATSYPMLPACFAGGAFLPMSYPEDESVSGGRGHARPSREKSLRVPLTCDCVLCMPSSLRCAGARGRSSRLSKSRECLSALGVPGSGAGIKFIGTLVKDLQAVV